MYELEEVSKRDLFAMAALQGILAGPTLIKAQDLAKQSYRIADAMLYEAGDSNGIPIDPPEEGDAKV